jgi:hypothetical protein
MVPKPLGWRHDSDTTLPWASRGLRGSRDLLWIGGDGGVKPARVGQGRPLPVCDGGGSSENRSAAPMRVSVVGPHWGQVASTSRGAETVRVETADVGLFYLHVPVIYRESMRVDEGR